MHNSLTLISCLLLLFSFHSFAKDAPTDERHPMAYFQYKNMKGKKGGGPGPLEPMYAGTIRSSEWISHNTKRVTFLVDDYKPSELLKLGGIITVYMQVDEIEQRLKQNAAPQRKGAGAPA